MIVMSYKVPINTGGKENALMVNLNGVVTTVLVIVSLALTDMVYSFACEVIVGATVSTPLVKLRKGCSFLV